MKKLLSILSIFTVASTSVNASSNVISCQNKKDISNNSNNSNNSENINIKLREGYKIVVEVNGDSRFNFSSPASGRYNSPKASFIIGANSVNKIFENFKDDLPNLSDVINQDSLSNIKTGTDFTSAKSIIYKALEDHNVKREDVNITISPDSFFTEKDLGDIKVPKDVYDIISKVDGSSEPKPIVGVDGYKLRKTIFDFQNLLFEKVLSIMNVDESVKNFIKNDFNLVNFYLEHSDKKNTRTYCQISFLLKNYNNIFQDNDVFLDYNLVLQ